MRKYYFLIILLIYTCSLNAIEIRGYTLNSDTKAGVSYVNIGILGQSIGTVSEEDGAFQINIDNKFETDTIRFSCIGFETKTYLVRDFLQSKDHKILLYPKDINISEVTVKPTHIEEVVIGNTFGSKTFRAGFKKNVKGAECGVLLSVDKKAYLKTLVCNITECTYDSLFFRVNVYEKNESGGFDNVLSKPIYVNRKISDLSKHKLSIDLSQYDIVVDKDFLITLEYIKDLGKGNLCFSARLFRGGPPTYTRGTSQATWKKNSVKIGFSVIAECEK